VDLTGSTGRNGSSAARSGTGEESASPAGCGLGPALEATRVRDPAGHHGVLPALGGDSTLSPVGHSLESERFIEKLHGGFS